MTEVNLPEGWLNTTLESLTNDISYGYTASSTEKNIGPKMLRITDIQENHVDWNSVPFCEIDESKVDKYLLCINDLVFARTGATVGKSYLIRSAPPPAVYASYLIRVRTASDECISMLAHFFNSSQYWQQITEFSSGIGQPNVNGTKLKNLIVPLPPLAEQKVIAEKLDILLAKVDSTKARLERIPEILKSFRQSVLAAAVSGKLTEEWRISESKPDSSISVLPENNKTRRGLPESVALPDSLASFSFPEHWSLLSVASLLRKGVIIDLKDGNHGANHPKSSEFTQEGLPFITAAQMSDDGKIDYVGAPKVSGKPLEKLKVGFSEAEDVIYSHKGTVGRVGIADRASVLSPQTTYIRLNQKYVSNRYYALMLKSHAFTSQVDAIKSQTTRDFVPITAHYALFAVIPPIDEQTEIVRRVEELFAFADRIEQAAQAALSRVNNLTQSILAKAFRGELTADWRIANPDLISGDNSAEALLTKIKTERAKLHPIKKARSKSVEN